MLAAQRQGLILQEVSQRGAIRISELAEVLNVSEMTVRRDVDSLADQGLVEKVHGGATAIDTNSNSIEPPFQAKSLREQVTKDAIASVAAGYAFPGASVALMGGSTVFAIAKHLANIPRLTVLTNSLPVSDYLHSEGRSDQTVILTGGLRTPTNSFVGPIAIKILEEFNIDLAFLGAHGMDTKGGFSSPNILEAEVNRYIRSNSKKVVMVVDHTKWGELGFSTFSKLSDVDVLVTDDLISNEALEILRENIPEVVCAKVNSDLSISTLHSE